MVVKTDPRTHFMVDVREKVRVEDISHLVRLGKIYKGQFADAALSCLVIAHEIDAPAQQLAQRCRVKIFKLKS